MVGRRVLNAGGGMISALFALTIFVLARDTTSQSHRPDTVSIVECLKAELAREDARLRQVERRARADLPPRAARALDSAGVRWAAYRLSECRAYENSFGGATLAGPSGAQCMIDLTRARARLLTQLYLEPQR